MANTKAEDFLAHHGVLGMKWGQSHASSSSSSVSTKTKQPSRRSQVRTAIDKKLAHEPFSDIRSSKTIKLGRASTITALGSLGSLVASHMAGEPKVKIGLQAVTTVLAATSLGLAAGENHSAGNDLLKKYGK